MTETLQTNPHPVAETSMPPALDASVIVISFNTRDLLRECLQSLLQQTASLRIEVIVVDNASSDGSAQMVEQEFPAMHLIRSQINLGFGNANNLGLERAQGRYFVLLNSDAFLSPEALHLAMQHMDATPNCAVGGARLVGRDGSWQPSARSFHSLLADLMVHTGLAAKYPRSHLFGRLDRTWADQAKPSSVDWVPGAFAILRPEAIKRIGGFDPAFFLYYEEVDLCLRFKKAGYTIWYWPDILVTHFGGESSKQLKQLTFFSPSAQVVLWRMRSTLLYYRKHYGVRVHLARWMEHGLYSLGILRNRLSRKPWRGDRAKHYETLNKLMHQAWKDTNGGRTSPPIPW